MPYILDTNSLNVMGNYYPEVFTSFWKQMEDYVSREEIWSVREVRLELADEITIDHLVDWAKSHSGIFRTSTGEETRFIAEIFSVQHFRGLVRPSRILRGTPVADPFVIAAAHVAGGCVITEEKWKPNAPQIPNVCQHFDIKYMNLREFMIQEGWGS